MTTKPKKSEHAIQNEIRNALAGECIFFRINSGKAWTGNDIQRLRDGSILIRDPRPFVTGVPAGFSDGFGVVTVTITPEMIGQEIGQAVFGEFKTETGKVSEKQAAFLKAMKAHGAIAEVWRSSAEALATIKQAKGTK